MTDVRSDIAKGTVSVSGSRKVAHVRGLLALGAAAVIGLGSTSLAAAHDPGWDQVENIKEAATRLAQMQRTQGATKTFGFIDACYRTHSLSSEYTKAFEACIAQDYMETQILTMIYSRTPPDVLKRQGAPTPKMLVETMSRRVGAAFGQYKVPKEKIVAFQRTSMSTASRFSSRRFSRGRSCRLAPPMSCRRSRKRLPEVPLQPQMRPQRKSNEHGQATREKSLRRPRRRAGRRLAHAIGAGRQRAGRAGTCHRPVLRAWLQHRQFDGDRDGA